MPTVPSLRVSLVVAATFAAACTVHETPEPGLTGPSEFATSITIKADPDHVVLDGVQASTIVVTARNPDGEPVRSLKLRLQTKVNGVVQDFGSLSKRELETNSAGSDTAIYRPPPVTVSAGKERVTIIVTPVGTNAQGSQYRESSAEIRLILPSTPGAPFPSFTFEPQTGITAGTVVQFDASRSSLGTGSRITNYAWDWYDGDTEISHGTPYADHDWAKPGNYRVTLTVTDELGQSASTSQFISVG